MVNKLKRVVISGGREVGGLMTFAQALAEGFTALKIEALVKTPREIVTDLATLRDPTVLKILSTTAVFAAPFARNAICIAHGFPRADVQGWIKLFAIWFSYKLANKFSRLVAVSDYVAVHLRSIFNLKSDSVIHNPLSVEFFTPFDVTGSDRNYITFVGRMHVVKNLQKIMPAVQRFLEARPQYKACFIGDGELRDTLRYSMTHEPRIEFTGSKDTQDVRDFLRATKIFISGCETEALGIAYMEALSQGCSIVMPASGGGLEIAPELIGKNIFLFSPSFDIFEIQAALFSASEADVSLPELADYTPTSVAAKYLKLSACSD